MVNSHIAKDSPMAISATNATNLSITKRHPFRCASLRTVWVQLLLENQENSGKLRLQSEKRRGFLAALETHKFPSLGIGEQAAQ